MIQDRLLATLREANRVAVFTGSGVSAENGVPTSRDARMGLGSKLHPTEQVKPNAFARDPALV